MFLNLLTDDMFMYSRYMGYDLKVKCTAFIPSILGFVMFFTLVSLYGRFPPNQDGTYGGRLKLRKRSSWRRERETRSNGDLCTRERCSSSTGSTIASSETESAQQNTVKGGKHRENATDL
ncbi:hypothetical protein Avbf_07419 [Armadillidium vulgare]|nr:hypothetical protein Avbf_07419 [Armadillidium vulgare]